MQTETPPAEAATEGFRIFKVGPKTRRLHPCDHCGRDITGYRVQADRQTVCIACALRPFLQRAAAPRWKQWIAKRLGV